MTDNVVDYEKAYRRAHFELDAVKAEYRELLGSIADRPKLRWEGSGKGAGMYVDFYKTEDGKSVIIGSDFEDDKPLRDRIAAPR